MLVQCKINDWTIKLRRRDCKLCISKNGEQVKLVKTRTFKDRGMLTFPKELYNTIIKDLTCANTYDRFLDKFWTWDETDEEC